MADTTKEKVLLIAPELCDVPPATFKLILSDVSARVSKGIYSTDQEIAQRYLTAHILTVIGPDNSKQGSGAIISERIKDHEVRYAGSFSKIDDYNSTAYGRLYKQVRNRRITSAYVSNLG